MMTHHTKPRAESLPRQRYCLAAWALLSLLMFGHGCQRDSRTVMEGEAIQALFASKTVKGHHDKHGYDFVSYYEPTGEFRSYQNGAETPRLGKWAVRGDKVCIQWKGETRELCRNMVTDGQGGYWKVLVKSDARIPIVTFKQFESGNPKGL